MKIRDIILEITQETYDDTSNDTFHAAFNRGVAVLSERITKQIGGLMDAHYHALVTTLGGTVEGQPTSRHNYLQRIRELIEKERRLEVAERDVRAAEQVLKAQRKRQERRDYLIGECPMCTTGLMTPDGCDQCGYGRKR